MKKFNKAMLIVALGAVGLLGSCSGKESASNTPTSAGTSSSSSAEEEESEFTVTYKGTTYSADGSAEISKGDNAAILTCAMSDDSTGSFTYASSDESVLTVATTGKITALKAGSATVTIKDANGTEIKITFTVSDPTVSSGGKSYASASYDEKSRILASLEKYAVDNYLTGITIFSDGSKMAYNQRYTPQPKSYISGYGWGTTREGKLSEPLTKALSGKTTYYNIGTTSLPAHANAMNASGSDVSTVYDYIGNAYYSTRMNQSCDGYEWYPSLATDDRPIPVEEPETNADGTVKSYGAEIKDTDARHDNNRRWRIHLRSGVKYRTGSSVAAASKWDGKEVSLDDYLTPIKFMLTAWNNQYRGAELTSGVSGFTGAATYYGKTSTNNTNDSSAIWSETDWNKIMGSNIYVGHDDDGDFIEFNLLENCTQFYAMYYLSNTLFSPLPEEFVKYWGGTYLGKNCDKADKQGLTKNATPLDTMLSTGPYYIEQWDSKLILFKKNDQYYWTKDTFKTALGVTEREVYNIDGIAYNLVEKSSQLKEHFLSGEIDSYSPKPEDLKTGGEFSSNEGEGKNGTKWRLYETKGSSNFKLNVNASTETDWLKRFGPSGTNAQVTTSTNTWTKLNKTLSGKTPETACKPYMSNIHFLNFLSFAINRQEICESRGSTPTQEYFSDNYLIDPENGVSYNSTAAHKAVLADRYNETYGFNETYAKSELKKAFEEVITPLGEAGAFSAGSGSGAGTSANPYIVPIDMEWMNTTDHADYSDVFKYVKKIFQEVSDEYDGNYKLELDEDGNKTGSSDYQAVYTLMKQGQFDLGFGSISGNSLNPLNFVEVLKSDNSSGFTLNWGPDTSVVGSGLYTKGDSKNTIVYDGQTWSYDGLWSAANAGTMLTSTGSVAKVENTSTSFANGTKYQSKDDNNKTVTYKLSFKQLIEAGATSIKFTVSNSSAESNWKYYIINSTADGYTTLQPDSNGVITLTLGNEFNRSEGSTSDDASNVTVSISYTGALKSVDSNGETSTITKEFTSTMNLLTYVGITKTSTTGK